MTFKMIVNGNRLKIAAFPESSKILARPGWIGCNGCLLVFNTKTLLNCLPFRASGFPGDVRLDNVMEWFDVASPGFTLVDLFNLQP